MLLLPCSAIKHWFIFAYKPLKLTRFICKLHFQMWFYAIKLVLVCQQWFHLRMYIVVLVHIKKNKKSFRKKGKSCRQIFDGLISHPAHLSKHKSCQVAFVMAKKKKKKSSSSTEFSTMCSNHWFMTIPIGALPQMYRILTYKKDKLGVCESL